MEHVILNIIKYILKKYPNKSDLSASRLTKLLYLADWKNSIEYETQITNANWHFHHYGPYVDNFIDMAKNDNDIIVRNEITMFGGRKQQFELSNNHSGDIDISQQNKSIIDFVINATKDKNYEEFIKLVYSTFPIVSNDRYSDLNLVELARRYKTLHPR